MAPFAINDRSIRLIVATQALEIANYVFPKIYLSARVSSGGTISSPSRRENGGSTRDAGAGRKIGALCARGYTGILNTARVIHPTGRVKHSSELRRARRAFPAECCGRN